MSRLVSVIVVLITLMSAGDCFNPDKCRSPPMEKHCLIEYRVRYRWPHQIRFVYNWYTKSCFEIRWSDNCPPVSEPTLSNNFATKDQCMDVCGGWA